MFIRESRFSPAAPGPSPSRFPADSGLSVVPAACTGLIGVESLTGNNGMDVIDIKIRDRRITARFREASLDLRPPSYCLVEVDGDREFAKVKTPPYAWEEALPPEAEAFILAPAQPADFDVVRSNRVIEREAFRFCLEKVRERQLPMALAAVERSFDGRKMRFFFTADNRIDFRELVKDLASAYRTRIEMRQIGVRDRSKKVGGYGICGQELCCSRFLQKFEPITIRMAKEQNLALNPTKISGLCGRLMCCLSYEVDDYVEARRSVPGYGARVETPHGTGVLEQYNYVKNTIVVRLEENRLVECRVGEATLVADREGSELKRS